MKDMLLTYNEYNRDLGYVQGMSDLLAPIYAVMQDDAIAFWGFVGFMNRMVSERTQKQVILNPFVLVLILQIPGAELPSRPIWNEVTAYDTRPACSVNGSTALSPSSSC